MPIWNTNPLGTHFAMSTKKRIKIMLAINYICHKGHLTIKVNPLSECLFYRIILS